jgi:HJR/Mrr/RecB family endonuclease
LSCTEKNNIDDLKDDIKKLMDFMRMLESLNHVWQEIKEKSKVIKKNYPYTELGKELNGSNSQKIDRLNNWKTLSNHINPDMNDLKFLLGEKEDQLEKELNKKAEEERIQMLINVGIDSIDKMDGFDFEKLLLTHFTRMGYKGSLTQQTQDFGADLIVMKDDQKHVVQAKRSASPVSVKAVQEIVAAKGYYCADIAIVVTNNFFTENARELAYRNKVELWDREKLIQFIVQSKKVNKGSANEK